MTDRFDSPYADSLEPEAFDDSYGNEFHEVDDENELFHFADESPDEGDIKSGYEIERPVFADRNPDAEHYTNDYLEESSDADYETDISFDEHVQHGHHHESPAPADDYQEHFLGKFRIRSKRGIKMELQIDNVRVYRVNKKGKRSDLPRKYGPLDKRFLYKGKKGKPAKKGKEGTAIELQTETGSKLEFETPKWFNSWCALKKRIQEAADIVKTIEGQSPLRDNGSVRTYAFPFNDRHLRRKKAKWPKGKKQKRLRKGDKLEIDVRYKASSGNPWTAGIQVSESFELTKFYDYMKEHIPSARASQIHLEAKHILGQANTAKLSSAKVARLQSLLEVIQCYVWSIKQEVADTKAKYKRAILAKQHIYLMSRTNLASIYQEILTKVEQALFKKLVTNKTILINNGANTKTLIFPKPYYYKGRSLKRVGIRKSKLTYHRWLRSIHTPLGPSGDKGDLLSLIDGDNRAMGRFNVRTGTSKSRYLVRFEARASWGSGLDSVFQPPSKWVAFAKRAFKKADKRDGLFSYLRYNPKDCP